MVSFKRFRPTPSAVIATVALVFAMSGGAYAAKKYLITSTKQISPSVLKSLKGASGNSGPAGPAGPAGAGSAGPAGGTGPGGPVGPQGERGPQGEKGVNGEKGLKGEKGAAGEPWPVGGTLPVGATETGAWVFGPTKDVANVPLASFAIPLANALGEGHAHFINANGKEEPEPGEEVTSTVCLGTAAAPKAASGEFCVYASSIVNDVTGNIAIKDTVTGELGAAGKTGASMQTIASAAGSLSGEGTWAVTG